MTEPLSVVVAGGGTAGHIEPALAVAEAVRSLVPEARITALGTARGLETTLVPARGFDLTLIPPVPVPRTLNKDVVTLPFRLQKALGETRKILKEVKADVVIGFGGYVCAPAYLAAKSLGIPIFIHEANARAGMANKLGAKLGGTALAAVEESGLRADIVGIPVRESVLNLDREALRSEARRFFGLDEDAPVLLVTGGSQGARSINDAMMGAAQILADAQIGVLHAYGKKNECSVSTHGGPPYVAVPYIDRMDLALAAADMILCRAGAMTVAEVSAVGLPAVYVPLPHGNGEQELNARPIVEAGGGVIVADSELTPEAVAREVVPLLRDKERLEIASKAAARAGHRDAARKIAEKLVAAARSHHKYSAA
ncbi:undecaprenyldiphospho-muramoylpentapeptide beta-N-acetylglucosaminyltransferase [Corynebacterium anserum]|uniref:UDP-N-acetylglucosamine--N-acetylmuramyl-(pentapeptide) pyrophosphoryl-undecaprenol N-acetylglucosamine transferase n=1 Tax=Corynebacterium anserum TaxID=2684406 RepID=A0A7G7YMY6_9CORY|nr:undecaprenyldiphospho-muramoylpentapeptide beta-N-acetylglucosaminyltransferase [Corynebacterium anserum]MBC2680912.1 undecaprenyldiphospho-muramoylpentapeptide beta-N-acetylglucosaminyltransferase [Corynebacterium anserum]QNH95856.1 undecaprenyldiphospho-muramoylpentapeptide beta-N-acetylglucosaminyltransferase [Corynebacterium anserum]